jgi:Ca2+-binding EF-hand superfamily protein
MKTNLHLAIILAGLTGVTASVHAQDAAPVNPPELSPANKLKSFEKEFDANHDGKLDETEKAAMVSKYDKNGNGKLDKEELPSKKPHKGGGSKDTSTNSPTH